MKPETEFLNLEDVLDLCRKLLGDPPPVRDIGLLGSAVARPQTTLGQHDAYPSITEKAAALLQSLVINHALVDGNKRLGWLATAVFLEINNFSVAHVSNDDVYELVMHIASNNPPLGEIEKRLRVMTGEVDFATRGLQLVEENKDILDALGDD
jgi:death-on-curing protein